MVNLIGTGRGMADVVVLMIKIVVEGEGTKGLKILVVEANIGQEVEIDSIVINKANFKVILDRIWGDTIIINKILILEAMVIIVMGVMGNMVMFKVNNNLIIILIIIVIITLLIIFLIIIIVETLVTNLMQDKDLEMVIETLIYLNNSNNNIIKGFLYHLQLNKQITFDTLI